MRISKGARVTSQPKHWYDGVPVSGWPKLEYVGTVTEVLKIAGCTYARVKYDSGRREFENVDRLIVVSEK